MNALDFPISPSNGQLYPESVPTGEVQYVWSSSTGAWLKTTKTITIDAGQIVSGVINPNRLPNQGVFLVSSESQIIGLNARIGDLAYIESEEVFYVLIRTPSSQLANWAKITTGLTQEELSLIENMIIEKTELIKPVASSIKYSLAWL
jgi:hypothetical protein